MDTWVNVIRRYFEDCGLEDRGTSQLAAERVVATAASRGGATRRDLGVESLSLARRWIADFAHEGADPLAWAFRARRLLQRFPASFLEFPIPASGPQRERLTPLPEEERVSMRQQEIHGPIQGFARKVGDALESISSLEPGRT